MAHTLRRLDVGINLTTRDDGTTRIFDWDPVPSERPLYRILLEAVDHDLTHGYNCSCMDRYIREVRVHIMRAIPHFDPATIDGREKSWERSIDANSRIAHILGAANRRW